MALAAHIKRKISWNTLLMKKDFSEGEINLISSNWAEPFRSYPLLLVFNDFYSAKQKRDVVGRQVVST